MSTTKQLKYKNSAGTEEIVDIAVDAGNVESNTFSQTSARANLISGEKLSIIFGKLMKWYTDLKTIAWSGSYTDLTDRPTLGTAASQALANNLTTTAAGSALDARQGKVLNDSISMVTTNLTTVTNNLNGCKVVTEGSGSSTKYYLQNGADTASKKELGNFQYMKITSAYDGGTIGSQNTYVYVIKGVIKGYSTVTFSTNGFNATLVVGSQSITSTGSSVTLTIANPTADNTFTLTAKGYNENPTISLSYA